MGNNRPNKFIDDGVGLVFDHSKKQKGAVERERKQITKDYSIEKVEDVWLVYDASGEEVGDWDTEEEAVDHARVMQESDDVS
jgi:hypothetical protein